MLDGSQLPVIMMVMMMMRVMLMCVSSADKDLAC